MGPISAQCLVLFIHNLRPIHLGTHLSSMPGLVHPEVEAHPSWSPSQLKAWCSSTTHGPSIPGPISAQSLVLFIHNSRPIHPGTHLSSKPGIVRPEVEVHPSRDPLQLNVWCCSSTTHGPSTSNVSVSPLRQCC